MKFKVKFVREGDSDQSAWWERYNKSECHTLEDCAEWAESILAKFNANLRPYERARRVVSVEPDGGRGSKDAPHDWQKTNLITVSDGEGMYDTYQCSRCGITGKRFGFGGVRRDALYRAKKWGCCEKASGEMKKK
jgi:hypothetical protein